MTFRHPLPHQDQIAISKTIQESRKTSHAYNSDFINLFVLNDLQSDHCKLLILKGRNISKYFRNLLAIVYCIRYTG